MGGSGGPSPHGYWRLGVLGQDRKGVLRVESAFFNSFGQARTSVATATSHHGSLQVASAHAWPYSRGWDMERRLATSLLVKSFLCAIAVGPATCLALHPSEAETLSLQTGKPLLALATRDTCPPCQALKHHLAADANVRALAEKYVVLYMDKESAEFETFLANHPAEYAGVPMVFILRPDGASLYGQSGGMTADGLKDLLKFGLDQSGEQLSSGQQIQFAENLNDSNRHLQQGELLAALRMTDAGAIENCFADIAVKTRAMRTSVLDEIASRLSKLDSRMVGNESMYGAAFRLAEFHAGLSDGPHRETAKAMLKHYVSQPSTRLAVAQGVELVKARELERRGSFDDAVVSYDRIISLDKSTPTADHAVQKLSIIRARIRKELASRSSSL